MGDLLRLAVQLTDHVTGAAAVPSAMTLRVQNARGSIATYAIGGASPPSTPSPGYFYTDVLIAQAGGPGVWAWNWTASGNNVLSAEEGTFPVATSRF